METYFEIQLADPTAPTPIICLVPKSNRLPDLLEAMSWLYNEPEGQTWIFDLCQNSFVVFLETPQEIKNQFWFRPEHKKLNGSAFIGPYYACMPHSDTLEDEDPRIRFLGLSHESAPRPPTGFITKEAVWHGIRAVLEHPFLQEEFPNHHRQLMQMQPYEAQDINYSDLNKMMIGITKRIGTSYNMYRSIIEYKGETNQEISHFFKGLDDFLSQFHGQLAKATYAHSHRPGRINFFGSDFFHYKLGHYNFAEILRTPGTSYAQSPIVMGLVSCAPAI